VFDQKSTSADILGLLTHAADLQDNSAPQAHVEATQRHVRERFVRILGRAP